MKLIKPLRMSLLHQVYRRDRRYHMGIAALALVPLRGQACLLTEMELWKLAEEQLLGVTLDAAIPKACPEFLVSGNAYGHYCASGKAVCEVAVSVGGLEKRLRVTGNRYWSGNAPTAAQPFEELSLDWAQTYGGAEFAENPLGKGIARADETQPLPNLEPLDQCLRTPDEPGVPINLGMVDSNWPQRYRLADDYDQRWLEEDYPGFSRNIDWHYFNGAQPDQWFEGLNEFPGGAHYRLQNLHPEHADLSGHLPAVRARCFLRRNMLDNRNTEEVPLRLTTVWFIPHCERAILIFNGSVPCSSFDGNDIACLLLAADDLEAPRDMEYFHGVLERRLEPQYSVENALNDAELIPAPLIGSGLEAFAPQNLPSNALMERLNLRAAAEREKLIAHLATLPKTAATPVVQLPEPVVLTATAPPAPENISTFIKAHEQIRKDAETRLQTAIDDLRVREAKAKALNPPQIDESAKPNPRKPRQVVEKLRQELRDERASQRIPAEQRQQMEAVLDSGGAQLQSTLTLAGHLLDAQPQLDALTSQNLRQLIQDYLRQGLPLAALELAGANLAGMDLRGADLSGADLDSANLTACNLAAANLQGTLLTRANLTHANLEECKLADANLGLAQARQASLRGADLSRVCLEQSNLSDCDLSKTTLRDVRLKDAKLINLNLTQAKVENLFLEGAELEQLCLHQAQIDNLAFYGCTLRDVDFSQAHIRGLTLIETDASHGISFQAAQIRKSSFIGASNLSFADFSACEMEEVCLRNTRLEGADFTFSHLRQTDLSDTDLRSSRLDHADLDGNLLIRSDLRGASIRNASLVSSILQGALLAEADLSNSNLFRADFGEVLLDSTTRLEGCYQERIKWLPRRLPDFAEGQA